MQAACLRDASWHGRHNLSGKVCCNACPGPHSRNVPSKLKGLTDQPHSQDLQAGTAGASWACIWSSQAHSSLSGPAKPWSSSACSAQPKPTHLLVPMLMPGHSRTKALCINLCGQAVAHELHVCDHRYLPLSILQTAKQAFSMHTRALGHSEQAAFIPSVNRQQQCESYSNQMQSLLPQTKLLTCTLMLPSAPKVRLHKSSEELAGCWKLSWTVRHPLMRLLSSMLQAVGGPKCAAAACNLRCVRRQQGVQACTQSSTQSRAHGQQVAT